jgi:hypothetical protein
MINAALRAVVNAGLRSKKPHQACPYKNDGHQMRYVVECL